jgi:hypothetical protein
VPPLSYVKRAVSNASDTSLGIASTTNAGTGNDSDSGGWFARSLPGTPTENSSRSGGPVPALALSAGGGDYDSFLPGNIPGNFPGNFPASSPHEGGYSVVGGSTVLGTPLIERLTAKGKEKKSSNKLNFQSALARFLGGGPWGEDQNDWSVTLTSSC